MSKITITRNCKNGEHVFIAGNTHSDGREVLITNWVCQHCLYTVSFESQWVTPTATEIEVIVEEEPKDLKEILEEEKERAQPYLSLEKKKTYSGKKRGPKKKKKSKPKGAVNGLPSAESV